MLYIKSHGHFIQPVEHILLKQHIINIIFQVINQYLKQQQEQGMILLDGVHHQQGHRDLVS